MRAGAVLWALFGFVLDVLGQAVVDVAAVFAVAFVLALLAVAESIRRTGADP